MATIEECRSSIGRARALRMSRSAEFQRLIEKRRRWEASGFSSPAAAPAPMPAAVIPPTPKAEPAPMVFAPADQTGQSAPLPVTQREAAKLLNVGERVQLQAATFGGTMRPPRTWRRKKVDPVYRRNWERTHLVSLAPASIAKLVLPGGAHVIWRRPDPEPEPEPMPKLEAEEGARWERGGYVASDPTAESRIAFDETCTHDCLTLEEHAARAEASR